MISLQLDNREFDSFRWYSVVLGLIRHMLYPNLWNLKVRIHSTYKEFQRNLKQCWVAIWLHWKSYDFKKPIKSIRNEII